MNRRALKLVITAVFVALLGVVAAPGVSIADPISDKQAEAQQLEAQINSNAEKLSALNEQMNSTQNELDKANEDIANADALVAAAKAKTKELRTEVARRAAAVYTQSGSNSGVEELDAPNAQDLSSKQKYSSLAAQRDNEIVTALARSKEQLTLRKADAEDARQVAQDKQAELQSQNDKLQAGQADLEKMNSKVTGELATLVQQAENERLAREKAAAEAQYAAQLQQAAQNQPAAGGGTGGGDFTYGGAGATPPPTSGGVSAVLAYAYAQLGKDYCYAGVGPSCYDCSGLTMMAWAQAGVSMSHGSYDQLASFPQVSMDQLQPGDLVYWDSHVGIYVGNGSVLHAPHTGTVVQITPIWSGVIGANRPG
ncbi:MAG TPA: NlpC/P60 family protein [Acidimicrobiia bacterium]|jgi:cell wall-associated NlpC family hydrolase